MKVQIKNRSSRRTQAAIRQAFAELLAEKKSLNRITVAELSKRAGITRGTFYTHYNNMYEVASDLQDEVTEALFTGMDELKSEDEVKAFFEEMYQFLKKHEELYRTLLSSDAPLPFLNKINDRMNTQAVRLISVRGYNSPTADLDVAFFMDGAMYMLLKYFRGELNYSLEQVRDYLAAQFRKIFEK